MSKKLNPELEMLPDLNEPFDVVYTWVNYADPKWRDLHERATMGRSVPEGEHDSANDTARYLDRGELYWSIRSVQKYAPWVRRIHIVTNCDLPGRVKDFANVVCVPHEAVFPDLGDLPTFNSHAIETVLHRVPDISRRFIYFNDDFFLCRETSPSDFFWGAEGVLYNASSHQIPYSLPAEELLPVDAGAINSSALLSRDFGFMPERKLQHAPYPLSTRLLREIEGRYPDEVLSTRSSKFRNERDLAVATTMHAYYAKCVEIGRPGRLKTRYVDISDWRFLGLVHPLSPLMRGGFDTLCLNEVYDLGCGRRVRDIIVRKVMRDLFQ